MKLPLLWLATAFSVGIAAGDWRNSAHFCPSAWLTASLAALTGCAILLVTKKHGLASVLILIAWSALGGFAIQQQQRRIPANDAAGLIASGKLDNSEPLRWRGTLREDPEELPWGMRYTINLEQVQTPAGPLQATGGLRVTYYGGAHDNDLPALRAGDEVEALCGAEVPRDYLDPGAFDERGYLRRQNIVLLATLRSPELLRKIASPEPSLRQRLARIRGDLLQRMDSLFRGQPQQLAVLRAMLLGDRNFINSDIAQVFQKTAAFHVLVVAGLHVAALAAFIFWLGRILRLPLGFPTLLTLAVLAAYVGIVQDRPPILRAALMTALFLCARLLFRRVALVNTVALAALVLLIARPDELFDPSFQLSFVAAGVIAGLALPWIERTSAPYQKALRHIGDATRDRLHSPRATQFRLDARQISGWLTRKLPRKFASHADGILILPLRGMFRIWDLLVLSFCIQLGMMPLLAAYFHRVSLSGPASNLPAVLLTALIVPLGFLALATSYAWNTLSAAIAKIASALVASLVTSVTWFSRLPHFSWRIPGPPKFVEIAFFAALCVTATFAWRLAQSREEELARSKSQRPPRFTELIPFSALLSLAFIVAVYPFAPKLARGKLEATVLDVGQGDSIFVAFPNGKTMLIDGGGAPGVEHAGGYRSGLDTGEAIVSPYLWSRGIQKLDVVLLSHAHHDHIGGLPAILHNFRVGELWVGRDEETPAFRELLAQAAAQHVPVIHKTERDAFNWGGVQGNFLWPPDDSETASAENNDSVVLELGTGSVNFLLPGDIEKQVESTLVTDGALRPADFIKVPHHGSKTSSTNEFLNAVRPRFAVISVGARNAYGLPNADTLARYESEGARLWQTDHLGAVTALTDGRNLFVTSFVPNAAPLPARTAVKSAN